MIVLGIDPGIGTTGWAQVKEEKGKFSLISSGAITTNKNVSLDQRLLELYEKLAKVLKTYHPKAASLETLFFGTNTTTAFLVGQARGVVQLVLAQQGIPIVEYNPTQIKIAITGFGNAEKGQIQRLLKIILKLPKTLTPDDVADAAAIALTHLFSYKLSSLKAKL